MMMMMMMMRAMLLLGVILALLGVSRMLGQIVTTPLWWQLPGKLLLLMLPLLLHNRQQQ
jgi:hypothetical protein